MLCRVLVSISFLLFATSYCLADADKPLSADYATARKSFQTRLDRKGPSPQEAELPTKRPKGVKEVKYRSGSLELTAWLRDQDDGKKHPAVVFCHGGFAFGEEDFTEDAAKFAEAGFVVLAPVLRGENGMPGNFELFVGEVDDVLAAGRFTASLPSVDAKRVFVSGHSAGGTVALMSVLLNETPFAAAAPIGPAMDILGLMRPEFEALFVFDPRDSREMLIRSPVYFATSLKRPAFIFTGDQDIASLLESKQFAANAAASGVRCQTYTTKGDHFSSKAEAIATMIPLFRDWKSEK